MLLTNGIQDPWQWASVRALPHDTHLDLDVMIMDCDVCGHATEFSTASNNLYLAQY